MSGWIINVDGRRPQNWEIAKEHAVWATTRRFPISAGDDLFFWKTEGGGLIAHAVASEEARPVTEVEGVPWPDHAQRHYVSRFDLANISESPSAVTNSWLTLQEWGEFSGGANRGVMRIDNERGVERLRALVRADAVAAVPSDVIDEVERDRLALDSAADARRFVERSVAERQGQPQFRKNLIRVYDGRCCVTDCDAWPALEAAHIAPYRGQHTNKLSNGLLLRADIHTLFDLFQLTVDAATRRVHLSSNLQHTQYGNLDQVRLRKPNVRSAEPGSDVLALHNHEFQSRHGLF